MVKRLEKFETFDGTIFNDETTAEEYETGLYHQWLELRDMADFAGVIDTGNGDFGIDVREHVLQDLIRYEFNRGLFHVSHARVVLGPQEPAVEGPAEAPTTSTVPVEEKANQPRILETSVEEEPKFEVGKY